MRASSSRALRSSLATCLRRSRRSRSQDGFNLKFINFCDLPTTSSGAFAQVDAEGVWNSIRDGIIEENGESVRFAVERRVTNLHEIWEDAGVSHLQKLKGFVLPCRMCHRVKHIGPAGILASEGKLNYNEVVKTLLQSE